MKAKIGLVLGLALVLSACANPKKNLDEVNNAPGEKVEASWVTLLEKNPPKFIVSDKKQELKLTKDSPLIMYKNIRSPVGVFKIEKTEKTKPYLSIISVNNMMGTHSNAAIFPRLHVFNEKGEEFELKPIQVRIEIVRYLNYSLQSLPTGTYRIAAVAYVPNPGQVIGKSTTLNFIFVGGGLMPTWFGMKDYDDYFGELRIKTDDELHYDPKSGRERYHVWTAPEFEQAKGG
jgi:hypothetical protein